MNMLREFVLILSTFLWIGAGMWIIFAIIATDPNFTGAAAYDTGPGRAVYVFGIGVVIFALTSIFWKKKED